MVYNEIVMEDGELFDTYITQTLVKDYPDFDERDFGLFVETDPKFILALYNSAQLLLK